MLRKPLDDSVTGLDAMCIPTSKFEIASLAQRRGGDNRVIGNAGETWGKEQRGRASRGAPIIPRPLLAQRLKRGRIDPEGLGGQRAGVVGGAE
ncbi:hypothetical protein DFR33_102314 [Bradymonas sediminis]|nr:hypothetical protein DFR33_102314 [Bradymonas sediminis]